MCVLWPSTSAEITFPRVARDRLIFTASLKRSPVAPVLDCRSEPCWEEETQRHTHTHTHTHAYTHNSLYSYIPTHKLMLKHAAHRQIHQMKFPHADMLLVVWSKVTALYGDGEDDV